MRIQSSRIFSYYIDGVHHFESAYQGPFHKLSSVSEEEFSYKFTKTLINSERQTAYSMKIRCPLTARQRKMKDQMAILGHNRIEDVRWLCSLTESELDLLIGLKVLIQQRAKKIGYKSLATKFDLKTLRALSFILMENLKGKLKDLSGTPSTAESSSTLDACNLLNHDLDKTFTNMGIEQLSSYICNDKRKRIIEKFSEDMSPNRKQRSHSDNSRSI